MTENLLVLWVTECTSSVAAYERIKAGSTRPIADDEKCRLVRAYGDAAHYYSEMTSRLDEARSGPTEVYYPERSRFPVIACSKHGLHVQPDKATRCALCNDEQRPNE